MLVPRLAANDERAQPGDVVVPWSGQRAVVFRATTGQFHPLAVPTDPAAVAPAAPSARAGSAAVEVAWSTATIDVRGVLWVLASSPDGSGSGGAYTWAYRSDDGGVSWHSHGAVDGPAGRLLVAGDAIAVLPRSACVSICVSGGIRSTDRGNTWTPWTLGGQITAADVGMTEDGSIVLRDATVSPQVLRVVSPTGSVASRPLPFPAPTQPGGMASSGPYVWVIQDVDILQRSGDGGQTWAAVPAR